MKNKISFLFCCAVVSANTLYANGVEPADDDEPKTIVYQYDAAGNRTARGYNTVSGQQRLAKSSSMNIADIMQNTEGKDGFSIKISPSVDPANCLLSVHDLSGKLVYSETPTKHLTEYKLTSLRAGCYIVTVTTGKGSCSAKIIINGKP